MLNSWSTQIVEEDSELNKQHTIHLPQKKKQIKRTELISLMKIMIALMRYVVCNAPVTLSRCSLPGTNFMKMFQSAHENVVYSSKVSVSV